MSMDTTTETVWVVTLARDGFVERTLTFDGRTARTRAFMYARDRERDGVFDTPIIPEKVTR